MVGAYAYSGELAMVAVLIILVALVPVLLIGTLLVEMLLCEAPRRGKRPDDHTVTPTPRGRICVVTIDGRILRGTACEIVRRLDAATPGILLRRPDAERLLRRWEVEGSVIVQGEWE
jgi:hypothetical protein